MNSILNAAVWVFLIPAASSAAAQDQGAAPQIPATQIPALQSSPSPLSPQQQVGPPELRNFSLPGETVVPAPQPQADRPTPSAPPAVRQAPPQPSAATPAAQPRPRAPVPEVSAAPAPATSSPSQPAFVPERESAAATEASPAPLPLPERPAIAPSARPASSYGRTPWLVIAAALTAALAAFWFVSRRRRRRSARIGETEALSIPDSAPPPPLPRARLALSFTPDRASLTAQEATLIYHFELRNAGDAPALNVHVSIQMFNAAADRQEIEAFFATVPEAGGAGRLRIEPDQWMRFRSQIRMPRGELREIKVADRSIFVPLIAFNVWYEWADGQSGQTAQTFLVGTEAQPPSEKMGPFRLDVGPRIYRSVGQRRHDLELTA